MDTVIWPFNIGMKEKKRTLELDIPCQLHHLYTEWLGVSYL